MGFNSGFKGLNILRDVKHGQHLLAGAKFVSHTCTLYLNQENPSH